MKDAAVNRLAKSITQLTLCHVTPVKLMLPPNCLTKHARSFRASKISQRVTDLEAATRQLRQINCILDSCTISPVTKLAKRRKPYCYCRIQPKGQAHHRTPMNWLPVIVCPFLVLFWFAFVFVLLVLFCLPLLFAWFMIMTAYWTMYRFLTSSLLWPSIVMTLNSNLQLLLFTMSYSVLNVLAEAMKALDGKKTCLLYRAMRATC